MDRTALIQLLGEFPLKVVLQPSTPESVDCGSYIREKVQYFTEQDERIHAYLCLPKKRNAKTTAIFCHHQHDWNFALGKSEVVGLAGSPISGIPPSLPGAATSHLRLMPSVLKRKTRPRALLKPLAMR